MSPRQFLTTFLQLFEVREIKDHTGKVITVETSLSLANAQRMCELREAAEQLRSKLVP